MLHSNKILKSFEVFWQKRKLENLNLELGLHIARGFADLGYEQYIYQGNRKIISLFTGKLGEIPEPHEKFFFPVYSADELSEFIQEQGFDLQIVAPNSNSFWTALLAASDNESKFEVQADTLIEVLLNAAITVCEYES